MKPSFKIKNGRLYCNSKAIKLKKLSSSKSFKNILKSCGVNHYG